MVRQLSSYPMRAQLSPDSRLILSHAAVNLTDSETIRNMLCPECQGGQTKELAFSITRDNNVLKYKCFRASCGVQGKIDVFGTLGDTREVAPNPGISDEAKKGRPYKGSLTHPPSEVFVSLRKKYDLMAEEVHNAFIRFSSEDGRLAVPVRSPQMLQRGFMLRDFSEESKFPKWDAFPNIGYSAGPWLSWHFSFATNGTKKPVVVVEDQFSAIRVARQFRSVALLGTYINFDRIMEISEFSGSAPVVLALDKDATAKAVEALSDWKFFTGGRFTAVPILVDLKYESDKNIADLVLSAIKE